MITHKHLYAWDRMMGSYQYWIDSMQKLAQEEKAPLDAIYRKDCGTWVRAAALGEKHHFWDEYKRIFAVN